MVVFKAQALIQKDKQQNFYIIKFILSLPSWLIFYYSTQKLPDFSLYFDGYDYYLQIPFEIKINSRRNYGNAISLDPGIRTFQTAYIPHQNKCIELCTGQSVAKLHSMAINLDRLISARKLGYFLGGVPPKPPIPVNFFFAFINC